jgi:hypothetical protein
VEPVDKPTCWDKTIPTEERRAKAKRQTLPEPEEQVLGDSGSVREDDDSDEPIVQTLMKSTLIRSTQQMTSPKLGSQSVDIRVARKFGRRCVFTGEIVEYRSADDLYRVEY